MNLPNKQKTIAKFIDNTEKFQAEFKRNQRKRVNARGQRKLIETICKRIQFDEEHFVNMLDDEDPEDEDSELESKRLEEDEEI